MNLTVSLGPFATPLLSSLICAWAIYLFPVPARTIGNQTVTSQWLFICKKVKISNHTMPQGSGNAFMCKEKNERAGGGRARGACNGHNTAITPRNSQWLGSPAQIKADKIPAQIGRGSQDPTPGWEATGESGARQGGVGRDGGMIYLQ